MLQQTAVLCISFEPGEIVTIFKIAGIVVLIPIPEVLGGHEAVDAMQEECVLTVKPSIHYERHFWGNSTSSSNENLNNNVKIDSTVWQNNTIEIRDFMFSYLETSCGFIIRCQTGNSAIVHYDLQSFLFSTALHASNFDSAVANLNCVSLFKMKMSAQFDALCVWAWPLPTLSKLSS